MHVTILTSSFVFNITLTWWVGIAFKQGHHTISIQKFTQIRKFGNAFVMMDLARFGDGIINTKLEC
jgi:hypothetical protein